MINVQAIQFHWIQVIVYHHHHQHRHHHNLCMVIVHCARWVEVDPPIGKGLQVSQPSWRTNDTEDGERPRVRPSAIPVHQRVNYHTNNAKLINVCTACTTRQQNKQRAHFVRNSNTQGENKHVRSNALKFPF